MSSTGGLQGPKFKLGGTPIGKKKFSVDGEEKRVDHSRTDE
jgi:hypothetical protein